MNEKKITDVVTPKDELVRFSYANVFEPTSLEEGQEKKYSVSILIPKTSKKTLAMIAAAEEAAKLAGKSMWGGKIPPAFKHELLRDGDIERSDDENYAGHYYISAKSKTKPKVWNAKGQDIDGEEFYSGCYGRVSISIYPYVKGSKGIAANLNAVLKVEDGEKLSGNRASLADFGIEDEDLLG